MKAIILRVANAPIDSNARSHAVQLTFVPGCPSTADAPESVPPQQEEGSAARTPLLFHKSPQPREVNAAHFQHQSKLDPAFIPVRLVQSLPLSIISQSELYWNVVRLKLR